MENVPGMLSIGGQNVAEDIGGDLSESGYRVGYAVLNAVWYGVPQFRERLFFIGVRNELSGRPAMPPASHRAVDMPSGYFTTAATPRPSQWTGYLPFIMHYDLDVDHDQARLDATSVWDALDDLPRLEDHLSEGHLPRGDFRRPLPYKCPPHSAYARLMRAWPGLVALEEIVDHVIRRTRRDYETFALMEPGDRYPEAIAIATDRVHRKFDQRIGEALTSEESEQLQLLLGEFDRVRGLVLPFKEWSPELVSFTREIYPPYPEDKFVDKWRKLLPDGPSWTVTAHLSKDSYSHIHYDGSQKRAISVREAARLQSFPDAFAFTGNMGDCYRQIGNAVPPLMAWSIAHTVLKLLGEAATPPPFG
jgi:DNA (cytosine-5)-methyltransferase 1